MKKINSIFLLLLILLLSQYQSVNAQEIEDYQKEGSCTSITVGRKASTDGSVMVAHTCDGGYRTWMDFVPAKDYKEGSMHEVYCGTMRTRSKWSKENLKLKGEIPQAEHCFAYLNTAYPCLNEKQLAIGETTINGHDTLRNKNGLFMIEELERIALQRCSTARDAIQLIGELIKEYGYGDGGECITVADKKEVWQMEIYGEGPDKIGGVWVAQRIPDNHVGISANFARIAEIDTEDEDYFMYSDNIFEIAKKYHFWDGESTFKFWKAYGKSKKPFTIREYYVFSTLAPSLNLQFDVDELPFSVKPDKKVSIEQMFELYRANYEGTEYDMTKNLKYVKRRKNKEGEISYDTITNPAAHPWMSHYRREMLNYVQKNTVERHRGISVQYCAYSWIAQLRNDMPDEIGGRIFLSFDVPRTSARIPIYCGNLSLPKSFKTCGQKQFSQQSAMWAFRRTSRLAMVKWGDAQKLIDKEVSYYEEKMMNELNDVEKKALELYKEDQKNSKSDEETQLCRSYLTNYSNDFARTVINRWWELGDQLWVKMRWNF